MAKWATQRFEYYALFSHSASYLLVQHEPVEHLLSMKIYHSTPWLMGMPWSPSRSGHRAGVAPVECQYSTPWLGQYNDVDIIYFLVPLSRWFMGVMAGAIQRCGYCVQVRCESTALARSWD